MKIIQRVGDRDKIRWSVKDIAFTVPSNPMSDRIQYLIYVENPKKGENRGGKAPQAQIRRQRSILL